MMGAMDVLLTLVGACLLVVALAGVVLGLFMATGQRSRAPGLYFALWWVPGAAAAAGVLMRDPVTFLMGLFCFAVAGVALALERGGGRESSARPRAPRTKKASSAAPFFSTATRAKKRPVSERARAREERAKGYGRAAS